MRRFLYDILGSNDVDIIPRPLTNISLGYLSDFFSFWRSVSKSLLHLTAGQKHPSGIFLLFAAAFSYDLIALFEIEYFLVLSSSASCWP